MNSHQNEKHINDPIGASINQMLNGLPPLATQCSIHRVPKHLVHVNPKAYTPQLISIGPFHHDRDDLMAMKEFKLRCLLSFLHRINKQIESVVSIGRVREWDKRARHCYTGCINMNNNDFVKMMLIDGCFIVEFVIRHFPDKFPPFKPVGFNIDPLFYQALNIDLYRDLIMLENQLPFFVLQDLFDLHLPINNVSVLNVIHSFFGNSLIKECEFPQHITGSEVNHLLDFLTFYFYPLSDSIRQGIHTNKNLKLPPTATELQAAGVVLEAEKGDNKHFMDISFTDNERGAVLKIPPLIVNDGFETYLRNLVAFEHYRGGNNKDYATNYVVFMDGLINTEKDVKLLMKAKIIINHMGSDEKVSILFNELCRDVSIVRGTFYFNGMCKELRRHCKKRRHRWMASLRRDYFHSPWALISFFAAAFLILLTFLQTVFSAVSLSHASEN